MKILQDWPLTPLTQQNLRRGSDVSFFTMPRVQSVLRGSVHVIFYLKKMNFKITKKNNFFLVINYFKKLKIFKLQNQKTLNLKYKKGYKKTIKFFSSPLEPDRILLPFIVFFPLFSLSVPSFVPLSSFLFEKSNCCPDFELVSACPEFRVCEMGVSKASSVGAMSSWKHGYRTQWKIQRENFGDVEIIGR